METEEARDKKATHPSFIASSPISLLLGKNAKPSGSDKF